MRLSNRVKADEKGFATATLKSVSKGIATKEKKVGRVTEAVDYEAYTFQFVIVGTVKDIDKNMITGTAINDIPLQNKGRGLKKRYNRVTDTCLSLGIVKESELATLTDARMEEVENKLLSLKDVKVILKQYKDPKTEYLNIDPLTIRIIEEAPTEKSA